LDFGNVRIVDIDEQMRGAYLDYAMSVIVARALPDARDGLKPVHRRILFAMHDMGVRANSSYKKSARIVGEVLGKYHPHGDAAVYDAMARMAQDFSLRYMLVDGQGNFGSIDGDAPAAMRYTEARLARIAEELLGDIDKDTVDFTPNFDGSLDEPAVLPARLPNLLLNGASGIAVGMATNIPPHNLAEVAGAVTYLIDRWAELDEITVEELMHFVKGPDFPTGALVLGLDGIQQYFGTGHGRLVVRAVAHVEEQRGGRFRIVVTELPYQVNKALLIERIAELAREGRLSDIADIRDESDKRGLTVIVELKRGAQPNKVLNQLYKYTPLQTTFGVQMLALVDGEPRTLGLKKVLQVYVEHRQEVITRRTRYELGQAQARAHILEGLRIALANLDAVIRTIRESASADAARGALMERFTLSEAQANAILEMQLRRLAALERQKIEDEYTAVRATIAYLEDLLAHPAKILALIREDMETLKQKFGDPRRTRIVPDAAESMRDEDLIPDEKVLITVTQRGYIKRVPLNAYRTQSRGGRGVTAMTAREEDALMYIFAAGSLDAVLFFSDKGKVYQEKVYQIPDADRQAKGLPLQNLLALSAGERVTAVLPVRDFAAAEYIVMATQGGRIKRIALDEFSTVRSNGLIAINLEEGDELGWAKLAGAGQHILMVSERGQALRFPIDQVRPMGRQAAGVTAMRLQPRDRLTSMEVCAPDDAGQLLVVTAHGYGKRTLLAEYPVHSRAGGGVATIARAALDVTGPIVVARIVQPEDEVTVISAQGIALRTMVKDLAASGRSTRGTRIIQLREGDELASVARLTAEDVRAARERRQEPERERPSARSNGGSNGDGNGDSAAPAAAGEAAAAQDGGDAG
jgi:DNA gyrase subunit A